MLGEVLVPRAGILRLGCVGVVPCEWDVSGRDSREAHSVLPMPRLTMFSSHCSEPDRALGMNGWGGRGGTFALLSFLEGRAWRGVKG